MRGKGGEDAVHGGGLGIIPAGAGKSVRRAPLVALARDHPRGCGEKDSVHERGSEEEGSSPRVRGKDTSRSRPRGDIGIIPAGAGKRGRAPSAGRPPRDHPRGCGEKLNRAAGRHRPQKSSPRVRGKVGLVVRAAVWVGIIPAGAGKSSLSTFGVSPHRDHPRGCGEKFPTPEGRGPRWGSSPRVRGKGTKERSRMEYLGIIPAGAGKRLY